jgi:hypothetical protein
MTSITIPAWKSFMYREVHIITAYKDGCIFRTKSTGKYILSTQEKDLPKDHIASSVSTKVYAGMDEITLPLFFG